MTQSEFIVSGLLEATWARMQPYSEVGRKFYFIREGLIGSSKGKIKLSAAAAYWLGKRYG